MISKEQKGAPNVQVRWRTFYTGICKKPKNCWEQNMPSDKADFMPALGLHLYSQSYIAQRYWVEKNAALGKNTEHKREQEKILIIFKNCLLH